MNKGKQTLYNTLVPNSVEEHIGKGREWFLNNRNTAMACRFYYYAYIHRKRYDDCLNHLSDEFFIGPTQIVDQLKSRLAYIDNLVEDKTPIYTLRKLYPFFSWSAR